jgi:hypothetical protein
MTAITISRLVGKACALDSETGAVAEGALSAALVETGVVINRNDRNVLSFPFRQSTQGKAF